MVIDFLTFFLSSSSFSETGNLEPCKTKFDIFHYSVFCCCCCCCFERERKTDLLKIIMM